MRTYSTSQIASLAGIHPNTVRLYEAVHFLSAPERKENGYRIFTTVHLQQIKLVRLALKSEVLQNGLRKRAIDIVKTTAIGRYEDAIRMTREYIAQITAETHNAEDAIQMVTALIRGKGSCDKTLLLTRNQAANRLQVTIDTLRNWEMNGLLHTKRRANGYRVYDESDLMRLKIIRSLRCANYSLTAILRLLTDWDRSEKIEPIISIDTPKETEEIVSVCDRLLTSLKNTECDAQQMLHLLQDMQSGN